MLSVSFETELLKSRPVRALWIEINQTTSKTDELKSRPVRALWIEIFPDCHPQTGTFVEAREGLVD